MFNWELKVIQGYYGFTKLSSVIGKKTCTILSTNRIPCELYSVFPYFKPNQ